MSKDAYYFSHDSNARNDTKILSMRCDYGLEGYGMYWMIVESLRDESDYKLSLDKRTFRALAMQMHSSPDIVEKFINDCIGEYELFKSDDEYFWAESLLRRMKKAENIREKRRAAANKRWNNEKDTNSMQMHNTSNTNEKQDYAKEKKGKEKKGKESKEHHHIDADSDAAHADDIVHHKKMDSEECTSENQGGSVSIFSFAEEQFARPLKKAEYTLLDNFLQTYPFELIQEAISRAVLNQATNLRYVQSILRSWSDKGIACLAEVEQEDKRFQKRKTYKTKGKDAKLKAAREARSSPGEDKIPDYYKIYEKRSAGG